MNLSTIPEKYRIDIEKAASCLKEEGCSEVFLFGSLVTGKYTLTSDIDLGVLGLPPKKYIRTCSKLSNILENEFDLVDQVVTETGYSSGEALKYCEENNIDAYIPNFGRYKPQREGFIYNKELDQ